MQQPRNIPIELAFSVLSFFFPPRSFLPPTGGRLLEQIGHLIPRKLAVVDEVASQPRVAEACRLIQLASEDVVGRHAS